MIDRVAILFGKRFGEGRHVQRNAHGGEEIGSDRGLDKKYKNVRARKQPKVATRRFELCMLREGG